MSVVERPDKFIMEQIIDPTGRTDFSPSSLKIVFERNKQNTFSTVLEKYVEEKKHEIESSCYQNYSAFLDSVAKLNTTNKKSDELREKLKQMNDEVGKAGSSTIESAKSLLKYQTIGEKLDYFIEVVQQCEHASALALKANAQREAEKFYHALVTLDKLQKQLQKIPQYAFAQELDRSIPEAKAKIKFNVKDKFTKWWAAVHILIRDVGKNHITETYERAEKFGNEEDFSYLLYEGNDRDLYGGIDFSIVYTTMHIYTELNCKDEFIDIFRNSLVSSLHRELKDKPRVDELETYERFFYTLTGYFAIEDKVLQTTTDLVTEVKIKTTWETQREVVLDVLKIFFEDTNNPQAFLKMKDMVSGFCFTMLHRFRLNVSPILELMEKQTNQFTNIVGKNTKSLINKSLTSTNYANTTITTNQEFDKYNKYNLLENFEHIETIKEPLNVHISTCIPVIADYIIDYMNQLFQYSKFLSNLDSNIKSGLQDMMLHVYDTYKSILSNLANAPLREYVHLSLNIVSIIQICEVINEQYQVELKKREQMVSVLPNTSNEDSIIDDTASSYSSKRRRRTIMNSISNYENNEKEDKSGHIYADVIQRFQVLQQESEKRILSAMDSKISTSVSNLAHDYDWALEKPKSVPSPFVDEIDRYLSETIVEVKYLPQSKINDIVLQLSNSIAERIMDILKHRPFLSVSSLSQLHLDIKSLLGVFVKENTSCSASFEDLFHIIEFVESSNLEEERLCKPKDQELDMEALNDYVTNQEEQWMEKFSKVVSSNKSQIERFRTIYNLLRQKGRGMDKLFEDLKGPPTMSETSSPTTTTTTTTPQSTSKRNRPMVGQVQAKSQSKRRLFRFGKGKK